MQMGNFYSKGAFYLFAGWIMGHVTFKLRSRRTTCKQGVMPIAADCWNLLLDQRRCRRNVSEWPGFSMVTDSPTHASSVYQHFLQRSSYKKSQYQTIGKSLQASTRIFIQPTADVYIEERRILLVYLYNGRTTGGKNLMETINEIVFGRNLKGQIFCAKILVFESCFYQYQKHLIVPEA